MGWAERKAWVLRFSKVLDVACFNFYERASVVGIPLGIQKLRPILTNHVETAKSIVLKLENS